MTSVYRQLPLFLLGKRCTRCGLVKPVTEFGAYHRRGKDGTYIRSKCLVCMREYDRERWLGTALAKRAEENRRRRAEANEKRCTRCGVVKPRSGFSVRPSRRGGMQSWCKECAALWRRLKHPDTPQGRRSAQKHALWAQGLKRCCECGEVKPFEQFHHERKRIHGHGSLCKVCDTKRSSAYRLDHLAEVTTYQKQYHRAHRPRINARQRLWAKQHPLVRLAKQSKRVTIQRRTEGSYTANDIRTLLHTQKGCCAYCACRVHFNVPRGTPEKATIDHIVPITRGGSNWPSNLCIACARCNSSKSNRLLSEWTDRWYMRQREAS